MGLREVYTEYAKNRILRPKKFTRGLHEVYLRRVRGGTKTPE